MSTGALFFKPADYNTIKSGDCITSGTYSGCIEADGAYYWIERNDPAREWQLNKGVPTPNDQVSITSDVWERCCEAGSYVYNGTLGGWYDTGQQGYQWSGPSGGDVDMEAV